MLQPFLGQSAAIRSLVVLGDRQEPNIEKAFLFRLAELEGRSIIAEDSEGEGALGILARQAHETCGAVSGNDLLVLTADKLSERMQPIEEDFSFRAVAVLLPETTSPPPQAEASGLRRSMFDRGLVCIASVRVGGRKGLCFLASDAIRSFTNLDVDSRGYVGISRLREGAGFANRLFRYACVKLYAIRHGLTAAVPAWEGNQLFGLEDKPVTGLALPKMSFPGFAENDRMFWDLDEPPININFEGYFQETPECWRRHRPLLRRMFQLSDERVRAIDGWRDQVTEGGERTLVAIHVRRGDYRMLEIPQFALVPEEWYVEWLRKIWPTLRRPLLFIGTDEPESVLPVFQEFERVSATFGGIDSALPEHIRDFEVLRRADYLAACNSSFSRMAAILGPSSQKCFLPSFRTQSFQPYEPWIDPAFWARFRDAGTVASPRSNRIMQRPPAMTSKRTLDTSAERPHLHIDGTDLARYLLHHTTLSGIQRVQCEILRNLIDTASWPIRVVALDERGALGRIDPSLLLSAIEAFRSDAASNSVIESDVRSLLLRAAPCTVPPRDIFVTVGAFWGVGGTGKLLQQLQTSGVIVGVFIHDILPIVAPEYFEVRETQIFSKALMQALSFTDFLLTTSEYNKAALIEHMTARNMGPLPVHVVPLGHVFPPAETPSEVSTAVSAILKTNYVLCVGTIEVRKNPVYLFQIWKMMVDSGRPDIPSLVFAGRKGWFVQDFMDQLNACDYLGGRIKILHNVTDGELDLLYQKCMLTMFPSFIEGWGLPVGESLAHAKICLCSATGGVPMVGGELADYIDPYNARDGLNGLLRYLDDPELRRLREREIAERFIARSWRNVSDDFLKSTHALARMARPSEVISAMSLPSGEYVAIGTGNGVDGTLSGELVCISGWARPESAGVRPAQPETLVRFRADLPAGARLNLLLRFGSYGRDFRIRVRSGSGAQTEATLTTGAERVVVLPCAVEAERLVSAQISVIDPMFDGISALEEDAVVDPPHWVLKGILYFDPKRVAAQALLKRSNVAHRHQPTAPPAPAPIEAAAKSDHILVGSNGLDNTPRVASFGAFLQTADSYWPIEIGAHRGAPIFADHADGRAFYSGCGNSSRIPQVGAVKDSIRLIRRSDQFVSTSRFSEGSVFDRSGVSRAFGYLHGSPPAMSPWVSCEGDSLLINEKALEAAPLYEHSYLFFYNGNLHNYYHWIVEGLLCLDILSGALGNDSNLRIVLPKSVDINALIQHRESLQALGFGGYRITEVAENLIRVKEAIWVDSDLIQHMPAVYLKGFQQRIAAMYAHLRTPRNRRLLVARKGPTRKIHNLEQVEVFLSRYGFETVYLDGMSTREQVLLFQSAEFLIATHGAGLSNLLFCERGTKVIELSPVSEFRPFFWMISDKLDLVYGLQFCSNVADGDFQSSIIVDVHKLEALMRMVDAHW